MDSNRGIGAPEANFARLSQDMRAKALRSVPELQPPGDYFAWTPDQMRPSIVGYMDNNVPLAAVRDAQSGSTWLAAVKEATVGGPLEILGSEVAQAANMGRLVERVHRLPGGDAAIPFILGDTADNLGIKDGHALHQSIAGFHARTMSDADAGARALDDLQRMVAYDATLGMFDRTWRNVMIRPDGDMRLIDHASLTEAPPRSAHGTSSIPTTNLFHAYLKDGPLQPERVGRHWELPVPDAIAQDFGRVTHARLRPAFDLARADAIASARPGYSSTHVSASFLDEVVERAAWIAEHARVPFTYSFFR